MACTMWWAMKTVFMVMGAGGRGLTALPSGMTSAMERKLPSLRGSSASKKEPSAM